MVKARKGGLVIWQVCSSLHSLMLQMGTVCSSQSTLYVTANKQQKEKSALELVSEKWNCDFFFSTRAQDTHGACTLHECSPACVTFVENKSRENLDFSCQSNRLCSGYFSFSFHCMWPFIFTGWGYFLCVQAERSCSKSVLLAFKIEQRAWRRVVHTVPKPI